MRIIRYFANKYPQAMQFIYRDFSHELKRLNLQEFAFCTNDDKNIVERIKTFNQTILEDFHLQTQSDKDIKNFCREVFSLILAFTLEN